MYAFYRDVGAWRVISFNLSLIRARTLARSYIKMYAHICMRVYIYQDLLYATVGSKDLSMERMTAARYTYNVGQAGRFANSLKAHRAIMNEHTNSLALHMTCCARAR
jgi:hypothetical protein